MVSINLPLWLLCTALVTLNSRLWLHRYIISLSYKTVIEFWFSDSNLCFMTDFTTHPPYSPVMVDNLPWFMALWYFWSIYLSICRWGGQWGGGCWCGDEGSSEASISANHWGQDQTSHSLQKEGWEAVIAFCVALSSLDPVVLQPPWLLKVLPSYWSSAWASPTFYVHQFCRTQENNDHLWIYSTSLCRVHRNLVSWSHCLALVSLPFISQLYEKSGFIYGDVTLRLLKERRKIYLVPHPNNPDYFSEFIKSVHNCTYWA